MNSLRLLIISGLLVPHLLAAQNQLEDSMKLASAIEWLEDKLTYYYYNVEDDTWWNNRFAYNDGSQNITIKNIASPYPEAVTGKTYLELDFLLQDLDPFSIAVEERKNNAGRLVKGKTIRVGAFDDQAVIRSRNGRRSNEQSFIYFSIPDYFEDSISDYSQNIADKLSLAIELSTRIYPAKEQKENLDLIRGLMYGRFRSDSVYWVFRNPIPMLYEVLVLNSNLELMGKKYIQLPLNDQSIEITTIYPGEVTEVEKLRINPENQLHMFNEQRALIFETINQYTFIDGNVQHTFIRDGTFDPLKARYR